MEALFDSVDDTTLGIVLGFFEQAKDVAALRLVCKRWDAVLCAAATHTIRADFGEKSAPLCAGGDVLAWCGRMRGLQRLSLTKIRGGGLLGCGCGVRFVLNACPNLTHLVLSWKQKPFVNVHSLHENLEEPLSVGAGRLLVHVELSCCGFLDFSALADLSRACPRLASIAINGSAVHLDPAQFVGVTWPSLEFVDCSWAKLGQMDVATEMLLVEHFASSAPRIKLVVFNSRSAGDTSPRLPLLNASFFSKSSAEQLRAFPFPEVVSPNKLSRQLVYNSFRVVGHQFEVFGFPYDRHTLIEGPEDRFRFSVPGNDFETNSFLIDFVKQHQNWALRRVLQSGYHPDARSPGSPTALAVAVSLGSFESASLLLQWSADPNATLDGDSIISMAHRQNAPKHFIKELLESGADPNNVSPSIFFNNDADEEMLKLFATHGAREDVIDETTGETPLHRAFLRKRAISLDIHADTYTPYQKADLELGAILVDSGAPLDVRDNKGRTPFVTLCSVAHSKLPASLLTAVVSKMLSKSPDLVDALDPETGRGCIALAFWGTRTEKCTVKKTVFVDHGVRFEGQCRLRRHVDKEVMQKCQFNPELVKHLLKHVGSERANAELAALEPGALLNIAANCDDADLARQLLEARHDLLEAESAALIVALRACHNSVALALLESGASVSVRDQEGQTALLVAIAAGNFSGVSAILKRHPNAAVHDADPKGTTPLMLAAGQQHDIAEALIVAGAPLEAVDHRGRTAIFFSFTPAVLELLLRHGANICHRDTNGRTVLHWAAESGNKDVVQLIVQRNLLLPTDPDASGATPLTLAKTRAIRNVLESDTKRHGSKKGSPPMEKKRPRRA